jgi:hypothetical protein
MRTTAGVIVAAVVLLSGSGYSQPEPGASPRLVLVLAIDQLRFDLLTRYDALYEYGFRTLLDRSAIFTNANYRHSATETGPEPLGHRRQRVVRLVSSSRRERR